MKKMYFNFFALFVALIVSVGAKAQPGTFIKGDYVEVGIASTGAFGTCVVPTGYHSNVTQYCGSSSRSVLGFVSDPDKDGWGVSAPGSSLYMGDYFVPGSPYEGWRIQFNGNVYTYQNDASGGACGGSACGHVSTTVTPTVQTDVWQGTVGNLEITQTTVQRKGTLYFVMYVDIVNTGSTTVNNIYYERSVDPDNEQPWSGSFVTVNKIVYQPNSISKNCLVSAKGQTYANSYMGLGSKDCRAKCYILNGGLYTSIQLSNVYNQNGGASGFYYNVGSGVTNDVGYGIEFNLGNLAAGQKTSLAYTYILKEADLDSALGETAPKFVSGGSPYSPYSTFRVCPGKTVPLKVINGGQYEWIWTPGTNLSAAGTSTKIAAGGTIPTVTGTTTYPTGAVWGDSCVVTVYGPQTYTALGISNCDTQRLVFYVDTINFSVPPSVTSPIRYCEGETPAILTAGVATGATLNWYTVATGGTSSPTAPTPSTAFPATSVSFDTTTYYVSQTNAAGCETPRSKIEVIVTKKPDLPIVKDTVYCIGTPTNAVSAIGTNVKWYDAATAGTRYPLPPVPVNSPAGVTSYFASQTINGCESDRATLNIEISQAIASFTKDKDSLCGSELLALTNTSTSSSINGYSSFWDFADGNTTTDSNTTHSFADARGSYWIQLDVTNIHGCKDSVKQLVEVFPEPEITFTASDTMICQGGAVDFQGTATPGYWSLTWDFGDGDPAYNTLQVRHAFTKSGKFNIQLQGTYPACSGISSGIEVNVVPIPQVNLGQDQEFCPGSKTITLKNINTTSVDKYTWSTGDTSATIQVTKPGEYTVTAQNWECKASDSVEVVKSCYLDIPNAFTPGSSSDADGYFLPRNILSKGALTFEMQIFDRWGQKLFETDKVDGRGWDGNYQGNPMPLGVYVYIIRVSFANGIVENYNGNITLVR